MSRRANLKLVAIDGDPVSSGQAPAVDPVARAAANDPLPSPPGWGPKAEDAEVGRRARLVPSRRRWRSLPALVLSLAAHAALVAAAASVLTREGSEAETDSVAVEIVFEAPPSAPAEPAPTEIAEVVAEDEAPEITEIPTETAEFVPPSHAATEALLAEPPAIEPPTPVETTEFAPPANATTEALLAGPPAIGPAAAVPEAPDTESEEIVETPAEPVEPVEPETIEIPAPDLALAVLSAPPRVADAPDVSPEPAAAPVVAADTTVLPDAVAVVPEPRPQTEPPVATDTPAPPAQAKKPATPKTADAKKTGARTTEAPKKAERTAEAKPAPAAKKAAAKPAAKKPAKAEAGAGAAASASASAGVEAAYGRKLLSHVERRKRYPAAARAANATGAVKLSVTIDRAGQLRSARVTKGSGHAVLDDEALATARRAAPYPAPPDGVGGKTFAFSVTLRFSR